MPSTAMPIPSNPPTPTAAAAATSRTPTAARLLRHPPRPPAGGTDGTFRKQLSHAARRQEAEPGGRPDAGATQPRRADHHEVTPAAKASRGGRAGHRSATSRARADRVEDEEPTVSPDETETTRSESSSPTSNSSAATGQPVDDETVSADGASDEGGADGGAPDESSDPQNLLPFASGSLPADAADAMTSPAPDGDGAIGQPAAVAGDPRATTGASGNSGGALEVPSSTALSSLAAGSSSPGSTAASTTAAEESPLAGQHSAAPQAKRSAGVTGLGSAPPQTEDGMTAAAGNDASPSAGQAGQSAASASAGALPGTTFVEQLAQAFGPDADSPHAPVGGDRPGPEPAAPAVGSPDPSWFGPTARDGNVRPADGQSADAIAAPAPLTEDRFAAVNHARIAREVRGELMPNGGSMQLRLDPPELGPLQVSIHLKDGVVTAAFQAQSDEAARLLSHTMGDLRASLEAHGVVVDKLHVQQAPRDESAGDNRPGGSDRQGTGFEQQQESRREQQRKDMVQRLWDKLAGNAPLDLVA